MKHTYLTKLALVVWGLFNSIINAQDSRTDYGAVIQHLSSSYENKGSLVNEFTGKVNYSIGLTELNLNGASYPIILGYNSGGIKIDDYASSVGLGWNLSAGGTITKVVAGVDDDYIGPNGEHVGYNTTPTIALNAYTVYSGQRDAAKDYYVYNIFGVSGKFAKFNTTDYATIEGDKFDINFENSYGSNGRFVITDNLGSKFYFTLKETITTYKDNSNSATHVAEGTWFLTSVHLVDGKQITLDYEPKIINRLISGISEVQTILFNAPQGTPCYGNGCTKSSYAKIKMFNTFNSYRLKTIRNETRRIVFSYDNNSRLDLPGDYALNNISVFDNDVLNKQLYFNYQYISKRLMLKGILESTTDFNLTHSIAEFDYYTQYIMPDQFGCTSQDVMGFYNGANGYSNCKERDEWSLIPSSNLDGESNLWGANRNIGKVEYVQTLMLKKITNKFGGVQELKYEHNNYSSWETPIGLAPGWYNHNYFGLRVAQVVNYNLTEPSKKLYHSYTYKHATVNKSSGIKSRLLTDSNMTHTSSSGCRGRVAVAGPNNRKIIANDNFISYEYVQKYVHTNESDVLNSFISMTEKKFSYSNSMSYSSFKSGNLLYIKEHSSALIPVDKIEYTYDYIIGATFPCVEVVISSLVASTVQYYEVLYTMETGRKRLTQIIHNKYNTSGVALQNETILFEYDNQYQVTKTLKKVNNVNIAAQYYTYPYHFNITTANDSYADAVMFMNQNNIRKPLLETINTRFSGSNEYVVASTVKLYNVDLSTNVVYVKKELEYRSFNPELFSTTTTPSFNRLAFNNGVSSFSNRFFEVKNVERIDNRGNVVSVILNSTKPHTSFSMSDGQIYADFDNLTYRESSYLGFEYYETEPNTPQYNENWIQASGTCFNDALVLNSGYTGSYALNFSLCNSLMLVNTKTMNSTKTYTLKYWRKQGTVNIQSSGGTVGAPLVIYTNGPWSLIQHKITNSSAITISSNDAIIDDLILIPVGGSVNYSVYDKLQRVVAKGDDTGITEFYEYDALGRLVIVRDANSNIVKKIEYGIKEQQ